MGHTVVASKTIRINKEKAESWDFIALYSSSLSREVLPHRKRVNERIKKEKSHCRPLAAWLIQNPGNSNKEPLSWLTHTYSAVHTSIGPLHAEWPAHVLTPVELHFWHRRHLEALLAVWPRGSRGLISQDKLCQSQNSNQTNRLRSETMWPQSKVKTWTINKYVLQDSVILKSITSVWNLESDWGQKIKRFMWASCVELTTKHPNCSGVMNSSLLIRVVSVSAWRSSALSKHQHRRGSFMQQAVIMTYHNSEHTANLSVSLHLPNPHKV